MIDFDAWRDSVKDQTLLWVLVRSKNGLGWRCRGDDGRDPEIQARARPLYSGEEVVAAERRPMFAGPPAGARSS